MSKIFVIIIILVTLNCNMLNAALPDGFQIMSASSKQDYLFEQVSRKPYSSKQILQQKNPCILAMMKLFSTKHLAQTFTNPSDEFLKKRVKLIHTFGGVAKINFRVTHETNYTGILKTGALGIIRLSLAKLGKPNTPGMAMKFLVDGQKSQNMFAMFSLDGQGKNHNFFANDFESKIPTPKTFMPKLLASKFTKALKTLGSDVPDPTLQTAREMAVFTRDGDIIEDSQAPFSLVFKPTADTEMRESEANLLIRLQHQKYQAGLVLYDVFTRDKQDGELLPLGVIELESSFIASAYGDNTLFFQHNIN